MKQKRRTIEEVDKQIARLEEQMRDKLHVSQSAGQDSSKGLQKLTALYGERRRLLGNII